MCVCIYIYIYIKRKGVAERKSKLEATPKKWNVLQRHFEVMKHMRSRLASSNTPKPFVSPNFTY